MQYKSLTIALMIAVLSLGTGFAQSRQSGKSRSGGQSNRGASGAKRSGGNSAAGTRSRSQGNRSSAGKSMGNSRSQSFGNSRSNSARGSNSGSRANNNSRSGQSRSSTRSIPNSSNFNSSNRSNNQRDGNVQDRGRSSSKGSGNLQTRGNIQNRGASQNRGNTRGQGSFKGFGTDRGQGNSLDRSGNQKRGTIQGRGGNDGRGSNQVRGNNQTFGSTQNRGSNRGQGSFQGFGNERDRGIDRNSGSNRNSGPDRNRGTGQGRANERDRDFDRNRGNNQNRGNTQGRGNNLDRNFDRDRFDNRGRGNDRDGRNDSDRNRTNNRGRGYDNDRDRGRDYDRDRDRGRRPIVIDHDHRNRQHNRDRVNDWYRNGDWKRNVTINGRHWNGRPWWHTYDYNGWRHGHWHGYNYYRGRDYWRYNIGYQDYWLDGLVVWGLGNLAYRTGYQHYCNPFYSQPIIVGGASIDYGYPISVQPSQYETYYRGDETSVDPNETAALARFSEARQAFYNGDKATALDTINQAIALMPDDTTYHEFRALVLFSSGQFKEAAETIYAVLAVAPGWDWETMKTLYRGNQLYIDDLRALEAYVRGNVDAAGARFLLAYHYITIGYPEHASAKLREVIALKPDAQLAQDLLNLLNEDKTAEELPLPDQDPFAEMRTKVVGAEKLVGTWKAERVDGDIFVNFADGSFSWDYKLLQNDSKFAGSYSIERDILMLATPEGSQLSGTVTFSGPDKFNFKVLGAGDNDPGIDFVKQ